MLNYDSHEPIKLSPKENELLKMLVLNLNDLLPRDIALNKIWRDDNYFTSRSMDVYIAKLRKYLETDNKIKIINIVSFSLIFVSIIAIVVFLKFPSLLNNAFQIRHVIIEGSEKSNISEIENNVTELKDNLIGLNFNSIKEIVESSEWVKRASIKKVLPSTLKINVTENDPYAIYFQEGKSFLIDLDGSIITEINLNNYEDGLLLVRGENSPELLEQLIRDISIAFPNLTQTLEEVEFIEKRRWNLKLNNKLLVKLPDENIQQSLKNLKQLFEEQEVMESNIIEIDLRIQGRAALKVLDGKINYGIDEI